MLNGNSGATDFEAVFTDRRASLPGADLAWLSELRESGINQFRRHGLPTPRTEAWKYTNLRPLQKVAFAPSHEVSAPTVVGLDRVPSLLPSGEHVRRLVLTEGRFNPELSSIGDLPPGVSLEPLAQAIRRDPGGLQSYLGRIAHPVGQPMLALNTALMEDGVVLRVGRGAVLSEPVEVLHLGGLSDHAVAYHPRLLVLLEADSRAVLVEHFVGLSEQAYFANAATEIRVAEGARLDHIKVQAEGTAATHLASCHVWLDRQATFIGFSLSLGAQLSRNEVHVRLEGEGARCRVQSRGVFQGRIMVHRGADKTDGHQLSKALLLSDRAEIDAKPELEIYADDVKCSHGATAGDIDEQALFYLRARGIPEARARSLLIQAFLDEALDEVGIPALHEALLSRVAAWLGTG
jgi:Fe-S cluster assembly protein SufD